MVCPKLGFIAARVQSILKNYVPKKYMLLVSEIINRVRYLPHSDTNFKLVIYCSVTVVLTFQSAVLGRAAHRIYGCFWK